MTSDHLEQTSAFLDGELEPAAAAAAERHIETCAECQDLVAVASRVSEALRGPVAQMRAPERLRQQIRHALAAEEGGKVVAPPRRAPMGRFWQGAASGICVSGLAAALALMLGPVMTGQNLAVALADNHVDALMRHNTIAVVSSSHHTVKPWFAGRAPISPTVIDHADQGFILAGGRVGVVAGRKAAIIVYRRGAHEIDLYAWAKDAASLPAQSERRGYHIVHWTRGDVAYAAISDVQRDELERFARLVQEARE